MLELCVEEKYKGVYPLLMTCIAYFIKIRQCVWKIFGFINSNSDFVGWLMNWKGYGKERVCPKLINNPVNLLDELKKATEVSLQNDRFLVRIWNLGPPEYKVAF
jgi:hypothetical protein